MTFNKENKSKCPCYGCTKRVADPNCHPTCEEHLAWKKQNDARKEAEREFHRKNDNTMSDNKKRAIWRSKRYSRQGNFSRTGQDS